MNQFQDSGQIEEALLLGFDKKEQV